jgi:hypothetical protein
MKRTILTLAIAVLTSFCFAQSTKNDSVKKDDGIKTIFGNKKISHGGYGAFTIGYSLIDGKDAFITGGRGAWVIGHSFAIGIGGSGFANDMYIDNSPGSIEYSLEGGYGGLVLEPILFPKLPVHLSFPCLLGAGGVAYVNATYGDEFDSDMYVEDSDAYLVAEPAAEFEMNLLRYVRLAFVASYRFTTEIHILDKAHNVLDGYNFGVTIKFGKF